MVDFPRRHLPLLLAAGVLGLGAVWLIGLRSGETKALAGRTAARPGLRAKEEPGQDASGRERAATADGGVVAPLFERGALFAYVRPSPAETAILDRAMAAPALTLHYVRVNPVLATAKSSPFWQRPGVGRVTLPLPEGGALTVIIAGSEMLGADRFTSSGQLEGRPQSRVVFAFNAGYVHATVDDAELGSFVLRVANAEYCQFYRVDPTQVAPCGGPRTKVIDDAVRAAAAERSARAAAVAAGATAPTDQPVVAAENTTGVEIHVMMVATQDVLATMTGAARTAALQSAFDAAMVRVNGDLAASQISARVKLVKVAETNYDEKKSKVNRVQDDALTALQSANDGQMDELHALRDQCGADLVCLTLNRADLVSSGLAFVIDTPGDTTNALFAFSVLQYGVLFGTHYLSHEFGHSFGCAHDRESALSPGAYPYSYGYRFFGADGQRYRDIMAYPPGTALGYFSNPNVIAPAPINAPVGIPAGRAGESDTARTIEQAAFEVSGYRLQTQTAPGAGSLINVATRATAGADERALIAGFTVTGTQPKTMLLRAAGPALAAFGVSDALPAPALELYSGATLVAQNAGWSAQPDAAAIATATAPAGAFAFAPGSADAALLATLAPGPYTALVRGAPAPGSVLIEAYETAADATRIVNLSTRAYADARGHPIVAGFVVRGAPGATKRVLVRVLGPSLARAPFALAEAMDDPTMEIRDAAGALILRNDDWSSGSEVEEAEANDFKPFVRYYNEKQIAATGFAPGNRREPCLMADLPAGGYSVIVTPFEHLPDAPAKPGVAIVEVYEITGP